MILRRTSLASAVEASGGDILASMKTHFMLAQISLGEAKPRGSAPFHAQSKDSRPCV